MNKPDFYVLGVMRSGTSSMFQLLSKHPKIKQPKHKEINYFSGDKYNKKRIDWYYDLFPKTKAGELTFDGSPFYFCHGKIAAPRIRTITPDAKFIILYRDPVARAWSEYCCLRHTNNDATFNADSKLMRRGLYYEHLLTWISLFTFDRFFFISSEYFYNNSVIKEISDFLDIEPPEMVTDDYNFNRMIPCVDPMQWRHMKYGYPPIPQQTKDFLRGFYMEDSVKFMERLKDFNIRYLDHGVL